MTPETPNTQPARRGLGNMPRSFRIALSVVVLGAGLYALRDGLSDLFPGLGADGDVTAAAAKATTAAASFVALARDSDKTGTPPRQTDAAAAPLLDSVFNVDLVVSKPALASADGGALSDWMLAAAQAGSVYIFSGTGVAGNSALTPEQASDPKILQQIDSNTVAYAPEIGRSVDAELTLEGALVGTIPASKDSDDKDGTDKVRSGLASSIQGAIGAFTVTGITDDWRRARLPVLQRVAPVAAKWLTTSQCSDLHSNAGAVGASMSDPAVKQGLEDFVTALKC